MMTLQKSRVFFLNKNIRECYNFKETFNSNKTPTTPRNGSSRTRAALLARLPREWGAAVWGEAVAVAAVAAAQLVE